MLIRGKTPPIRRATVSLHAGAWFSGVRSPSAAVASVNVKHWGALGPLGLLAVGASVVGAGVGGTDVGFAVVGAAVVGADVDAAVGAVVGADVGGKVASATVGTEVVGAEEAGAAVGSGVLGAGVGGGVGGGVVGSGVVQSPSIATAGSPSVHSQQIPSVDNEPTGDRQGESYIFQLIAWCCGFKCHCRDGRGGAPTQQLDRGGEWQWHGCVDEIISASAIPV